MTQFSQIIKKQICPTTIDFMDKNSLKTIEEFKPLGLLTDNEAALIIEVDGFEKVINAQISLITSVLNQNKATYVKCSSTKEEADKIWMARRSSMAACISHLYYP